MESSTDRNDQSNASGVLPNIPGVDPSFWKSLLDELQDAVAFLDADFRVLLWSPGAERLTGINSQCIRGKDLLSIFSPLLPEQDAQRLGKTLQDRESKTLRLSLQLKNSSSLPADCRIIPLETSNAELASPGTVLLIQDASSRLNWERERLALREETRRDPLTGVANRTELERVHAEFIASHRRRGAPYSLIVGDIDRFKRINDEQGHPIGDDVILALVVVLQAACREGDLVGRYGGEEFVMLCANCGLADAARRAEAMRETFAQTKYARLEGDTPTVSFGAAELKEGDTVETVFDRADQRLLRAKSEGRNRVVS
jgi:diguanylate cyclase (GGDEF)-like protein/PAS domain S-box-containing protein